MKAIHRFLGLAVVFSAALAANVSAQNPCDDADGITALDAKIRNNYLAPETRAVALEAAKLYLQKYGECEPKNFSAYLKENLAKWEQDVENFKREEKIRKFNEAVKEKRFDEVYAVGSELVKLYPDNVHFMFPLGVIGLYESYKNNFKYNDETIKYAKMALAKLKSGTAEPKMGKGGKPVVDAKGNPLFGTYQFERTAEDAVSELNYTLAYILYHARKDKRAGLLYYYEVSQLPGLYRQEPRLFATVGQYYLEESAPIGKEIAGLLEKQEAAPTAEEKEKLEAEIKPKVALFNGYRQRAADAFSRAYKYYDDTVPAEKTAKTQLFAKLSEMLGTEAYNLDKKIAAVVENPFPNPTSEVKPVSDPEPAKAIDTPAPSKPAKGKPVKSKPVPRRKPRS